MLVWMVRFDAQALLEEAIGSHYPEEAVPGEIEGFNLKIKS